MLGKSINKKFEKKGKKQNMPKSKKYRFLIVTLTFIMCVFPPLVTVILLHILKLEYEYYDAMSHLILSTLLWLECILTSPQNGIWYLTLFSMTICVLVGIAVLSIC